MEEYLKTAEDRQKSILNGTNHKFYFEHQEVGDVDAFKNGIFENRYNVSPLIGTLMENSIFPLWGTNYNVVLPPLYIPLQANQYAGTFVKDNSFLIENAASEFGVNSDLVKAVIYTEMSRGWYDNIFPPLADTILPGNIDPVWEALIPGSDVHNVQDNIRLTAKLLSEISSRLDEPYPEDVYALYNGLAHDRTYENLDTKSTPYFMKKVMEEKAWEDEEWELSEDPDLPGVTNDRRCFSAGTLIDMADGSRKPIEQIEVGDEVLAYDPEESDGRDALKPARVARTMVNQVEEIIDFHGLKMTPGHATLCGDGPHQGEHIPIMDILLADGAIVNREGELIRAATNLPVDSEGDQFVSVAYILDKSQATYYKGRMRVGTLMPGQKGGADWRVMDALKREGYVLDADGLISRDGETPHPLYWFGPLPKPEDYVLAKSRLTIGDLYSHREVEWSSAIGASLPQHAGMTVQ